MIYLDNASTTKVKQEVIDIISDTMINHWYNPSGLYFGSRESHKLLNNARKCVADFINAKPEEIIFTSSGSESNNMAIKGFLNNNHDYVFIKDPLSHSSVIGIDALCNISFCNENGHVDIYNLELICHRIKTNGGKPFLSIVEANNEIGTIQDVKKISRLIHKYGGVIHVDCTQSLPDHKIDVKKMDIDMMTVSGHKIGTPPGIAILYIKKGIEISPIINGEQENKLRGGTENLPYILGFEQAIKTLNYNKNQYIKDLRDYAIDRFTSIDKAYLVGDKKRRLCNNINICFKDIDAQALLYYLDLHGVCCSVGSACNSFNYKPSHVLKALMMSDEDALSCIRFTLSEDNTYDEIDKVYEFICNFYKLNNKNLKVGDENIGL